MQKGQHLSVTLNAADLHDKEEHLDDHEIASRLSEAIIDSVNSHKDKGWRMTNIEFNSGIVTIHFHKPKKRKTAKRKSADNKEKTARKRK